MTHCLGVTDGRHGNVLRSTIGNQCGSEYFRSKTLTPEKTLSYLCESQNIAFKLQFALVFIHLLLGDFLSVGAAAEEPNKWLLAGCGARFWSCRERPSYDASSIQ